MKIYLASSWRNFHQPLILETLRGAGHDVYDFRHPHDQGPHADRGLAGESGFHWSALDPEWRDWSPERYIKALADPLAEWHFKLEALAVEWCEVCVLLLPCGRSAHLGLGMAKGLGKKTAILLSAGGFEPELMYHWADHLAARPSGLLKWLAELEVDEAAFEAAEEKILDQAERVERAAEESAATAHSLRGGDV
jgi:hypothetical protein